MDLRDEKAALRKVVVGRLRSLASDVRLRKSALLLERLEAEPAWVEAAEVLAYHPLPEEVALLPALERLAASGRRLWLPRVAGDSLRFHRVEDLRSGLERHAYGMQEPRPELPLFDPARARGPVLVVTPGVAFDRRLNRLGRGRGYYDRFLRSVRSVPGLRLLAVAVAFSEQLVGAVPHQAEDERVDALVTELEVLRGERP